MRSRRAEQARAGWAATSLAERARICRDFADRLAARADALGEELSWQMGRPIRFAPREVHDRRRPRPHDGRPRRARPGRHPGRRRRGLRALHQEGAVGYRLGGSRLELPLPDRGQLGGARPARRQRGDPQALLADTAVRRGASPRPSPKPACRRACLHSLHTDHASTERAVGDPRVDFVAFTGSVRGGHAMVQAAAAALHRLGPRARRQGPGLRARRRRPRPRGRESGRRQLLQLGPVVLRHRADLRPPVDLRRFRRRLRRADRRSTGSATRSTRTPTSDRWCERRTPTSCAARSTPPSPPARAP